jgi:RHS repeat-associated protein
VYDGSGQRVVKANLTEDAATAYLGGTEVTDPDTAVNHTDDAQLLGTTFVTATRFYTFGGATVAVRDGSQPLATGLSLLLGDSQGSAQVMMPVVLNATTGAMETATSIQVNAATRSSYMPYGAVRGTDELAIDRGWLNQVSDETDTGLVYLNARYYDPVLSRFLSPDPLMNPTDPRTLDPYRYGDNNPVVYSDMLGLCPGCTVAEVWVYGAYFGKSLDAAYEDAQRRTDGTAADQSIRRGAKQEVINQLATTMTTGAMRIGPGETLGCFLFASCGRYSVNPELPYLVFPPGSTYSNLMPGTRIAEEIGDRIRGAGQPLYEGDEFPVVHSEAERGRVGALIDLALGLIAGADTATREDHEPVLWNTPLMAETVLGSVTSTATIEDIFYVDGHEYAYVRVTTTNNISLESLQRDPDTGYEPGAKPNALAQIITGFFIGDVPDVYVRVNYHIIVDLATSG